jgi:hypothetical protein
VSTLHAPPRREAPSAPTPALDRVVARARRRMRLNRALAVAGPAMLVAGAAAALWLVVGRFVLLPDVDVAVLVGAVLLAAVAVLAAAATRIPDTWAAWAADRWLGTHDAFATAVELRGAASPLATRQAVAAENRAAEFDGWPDGPVVPRRPLALGVGALLVAAGLAVAPNPQDDVRERRAAEEALVTDEAERLRDQAEQLREAGDPEQEALADRLESLADDLEQGDLEDAIDELADARAELEELLADDLAGQRTALSGLRQELTREPLADGDSVRQQLDRLADEAGAGEHAGDEELADRLDQLADALRSGQPDVAESLADAADAIRSGDDAAAEEALDDASGAVGDALDQLLDDEATQDAAGGLDEAQDRLGEAQEQLDRGETPDALQPPGDGQPDDGASPGDGTGQGQQPGDGTGQGQQPGDGQGQQPGDGTGQGQQPGDGQGQGQQPGQQPGQGQGQGTGQGGQGGGGGGGNPTGSQGQGGPNTGGGTPNAGTPGELDLETVYDPPSGTIDGEDVNLGGTDSGRGDSETVGSSQGQGTQNLGIVPYRDVLADYRERASRTIERPGFPVELRDLVRDYFDRIGSSP